MSFLRRMNVCDPMYKDQNKIIFSTFFFLLNINIPTNDQSVTMPILHLQKTNILLSMPTSSNSQLPVTKGSNVPGFYRDLHSWIHTLLQTTYAYTYFKIKLILQKDVLMLESKKGLWNVLIKSKVFPQKQFRTCKAASYNYAHITVISLKYDIWRIQWIVTNRILT